MRGRAYAMVEGPSGALLSLDVCKLSRQIQLMSLSLEKVDGDRTQKHTNLKEDHCLLILCFKVS